MPAAAAPTVTGTTVAVAFSGGRDSTALLHATCHAARALGLKVVALHVHHGLLPDADQWTRWGAALCRRWAARGLPLRWCCERLDSRPAAGDSVEAWARRQRYHALAAMARGAGASLILLGQHRRDQAETVLLQALRGAGPAGLAAMPRRIERDQLTWARPWLDWPREAIDAYVARHRLKFLHDPSNDDARYARNRLRAAVWPALQSSFADAEPCLAALARRAQEADAALAELAALDMQACTVGEALITAEWRRLSPARQANALRAWLRGQRGRGPAETLVQRLLAEIGRTSTRWPLDRELDVSLHRGRLRLAAPLRPSAADPVEAIRLDLSRPGVVQVPAWRGRFEVDHCRTHGLAPEALAEVWALPRQGGERFQIAPRSLPRALKKQYQALDVPDHQRRGPLLWVDGRLLYVPGLGIDARAWADAGSTALVPRWIGDSQPSVPGQEAR
jgi:tRNA(Ile)-lysidine synthase